MPINTLRPEEALTALLIVWGIRPSSRVVQAHVLGTQNTTRAYMMQKNKLIQSCEITNKGC